MVPKVQNLAVTVRTARFITPEFDILPTAYLYATHVSKKNSKFFLYSIQLLVIIPEVASVYRAVRSGSLNKTNYVLSFFKGLIWASFA